MRFLADYQAADDLASSRLVRLLPDRRMNAKLRLFIDLAVGRLG